MITESGKVMAVEADGVWVETANQSACSRCVARKGCGQSLLVQVDGHRSYIKAAFNDFNAEDFREGQIITIGVDEAAVLRGSLLVYCTPLVGLVGGATLANNSGLSEAATILSAIAGLFLAAVIVRWLSYRQRNDQRYQPVVVDVSDVSGEQIVSLQPDISQLALNQSSPNQSVSDRPVSN